MNRGLPLLCALLLLSAATVALVPVAGAPVQSPGSEAAAAPVPTAGHDVAEGPPPVVTNGSVARMMIDEASRTNRSTVTPDLTTTLSTSTDAIGDKVDTLTIQEEFDTATSNREREDIIIRALITLDERSTALVDRHRQAIQAYADHTISTQELLRRLAVIDEESRELDDRLDRLQFLAERAEAEHLFSRLTTIRNRLRGVQNQFQQKLANGLASSSQLPPVHIEVGTDSIVIAAIMDGEYVRTSYFHDLRNTSGPLALDTQGEAVERAQEYYPWAWDTSNSFSTSGTQFADVFVARSNHKHGELTSFFDMHSGNVYKEVHHLSLSEIPTTPGPEAADAGYRVVLNRTYPGGPMAVEVYSIATGERVTARVSVDGGPFRETGADGERWLVEPRLTAEDTSYTVRVVVESQGITLNVSRSQQSITSA